MISKLAAAEKANDITDCGCPLDHHSEAMESCAEHLTVVVEAPSFSTAPRVFHHATTINCKTVEQRRGESYNLNYCDYNRINNLTDLLSKSICYTRHEKDTRELRVAFGKILSAMDDKGLQ